MSDKNIYPSGEFILQLNERVNLIEEKFDKLLLKFMKLELSIDLVDGYNE